MFIPLVSLPADVQGEIFALSIENNVARFVQFATVCRAWKDMVDSCSRIWKTLLDYKIDKMTYPIDISSAASPKEQLKILTETVKKDFEEYLSAHLAVPIENTSSTRKSDFTQQLIHFVKVKKLHEVAMLFLFRPQFNVTEVAKELVIHIGECQGDGYRFVFAMLIKLHYDLADFFNKLSDYTRSEVTAFALTSEIELTISDYKQSGYNFATVERNTVDTRTNYSSLISTLLIPIITTPLRYYTQEGFSRQRFEWHAPASFTEEKLQQLKRKTPVSERDIQKFLRDLIFTCDLNLNIQMPKVNQLPADTVISQFKTLAYAMPGNNAFKAVWNEYHQKQQELLQNSSEKGP